MASKVEEEVDRADRLATRLEHYEDGEPPAEKTAAQEIGSNEVNSEDIDRDVTVENFAMARIGRRMMWIACALVLVMATHPGVRGFFLNMNPDNAKNYRFKMRPTPSELDTIKELKVLPIDGAAGQIQFEVLAKSHSSITVVESASHLQQSETGQVTKLKHVRCVASETNHLNCSAQFDATAAKVSYLLRVVVKNGNGNKASALSEHLTLSGAGPSG